MNYNDEQLIDEKTLSQMAVAYSATLKALENSKALQDTIPDSPTAVENLLIQILEELKLIREQIAINKRIRLS